MQMEQIFIAFLLMSSFDRALFPDELKNIRYPVQPKYLLHKEAERVRMLSILNLSWQLKGLAQAKITKKSLILFWVLNMTI